MKRTYPEKWGLIDRYAETLGASAAARKKWRQRQSVPPSWRIEIVKAAGGTLCISDFDEVFGSLAPAAQIVTGLSNEAAR